MADVTIIPPTQIQTVAAAGGQTQQNPPQPSLPQGTLVSGTIAGKDALGNYLLKSPQGTFTLQSSTPLTYNSDVTIRIGQNAAGSTSARIITVNGEPFSQFSTPEPETADSVSPTLLTQTPETPAAAPPATANTAASVRAVVVSAPPPPQQSTAATLSAGNTVVVRLSPQAPAQPSSQNSPQTQAVAPPESSPTVSSSVAVAAQPEQVAQNPQPVAPQPAVPQQPTAATPAGIPASAAPVETELPATTVVTQTSQTQSPQTAPGQAQPQQTVSQQSQPQEQALPASQPTPSAPVSALYSVYTKQSATPAPASAAAQSVPTALPATAVPAPATSAPIANTIPAQIVSTDENGTITLQTALGNVTVQAPALPGLSVFSSGASVLLELQAPATPAQTANPLPATLTELASSWQSLKDIVSLVSNSSPTAANALLARLPQISPDFASSSTAFITTLLQGNARKLLGDDTVDILRQNGREDLVEKFSAEMANINSSFTATPQRQTAGWQTLFLPFVYQEALQQARIYVKRDTPKKERSSSKNSTADTRFVVEVDLSEIGPLQMDGLVRKKEQTTAFDLVIRSHHAFSLTDQKEIAGIYAEAAQLTGFKGSLAFQVTRDFSVKPLEEAAGEAHSITA